MTRRLRIFLSISVVLAGVASLAALVAYQSLRQVPSFYQAAVEQDEEVQAEASDECLRQAAALVSDLRRPGRWQAVFTAEQINGWLAVDLVKNYPTALPAEFENPRIDIQSQEATLACGYIGGGGTTVVSISLDLYLSSPDVVALRVRGVRAGLLPVPLASVLEAISAAARSFDLDLQWRQLHGDPVALVRLPPAFDDDENELRLDTVELADGVIRLAGQTICPGGQNLVEIERPAPKNPVVDRPAPGSVHRPEIDTPEVDMAVAAEDSASFEDAIEDEEPPIQAQVDSPANEKLQR